MCPAARSLTAFKVAITGRSTPLSRLEPIGVHGKTHRAAGLAPLETGVLEHLMQSLALGLGLHQSRPGDDHRKLDVSGHALAQSFDDPGRLPQILDPAVGARADEHLVQIYS